MKRTPRATIMGSMATGEGYIYEYTAKTEVFRDDVANSNAVTQRKVLPVWWWFT